MESAPSVDYGHEVFIREGCLHCHSQYERPQEARMLVSGLDAETQSQGEPVLIGNRRQGPDLSQAGVWHSEQWHREHLRDPQLIRPGSRMPSYAYLFEEGDVRGEALVMYLASLGAAREGELKSLLWQSDSYQQALPGGDAGRGRVLYRELCASCHGDSGRGDGPAAGLFDPVPADFAGPLKYAAAEDGSLVPEAASVFIRQGITGTAMPGHPWLAENEVADLVACLIEFNQKQKQ